MDFQSMSAVAPTKGCVNKCPFCVSRMHCNAYANRLEEGIQYYHHYRKEYIKRMEFARDNGCNVMMITGNGEPQQNRRYLQFLGEANASLVKPFRWIELQTTGVMLNREYLDFLRNHVGVSTISLSISAFDSKDNAEIIGMRPEHIFKLEDLCPTIKEFDFNLRLSVNLTDWFDRLNPEGFFTTCNTLGADQVTLRVLYQDGTNSPQAKWVREHGACQDTVRTLNQYVTRNGKPLEMLEYGRTKYSLHGMSTVVDNDCMSKELKSTMKYAILYPDCKLRSKWDDPASLIF